MKLKKLVLVLLFVLVVVIVLLCSVKQVVGLNRADVMFLGDSSASGINYKDFVGVQIDSMTSWKRPSFHMYERTAQENTVYQVVGYLLAYYIEPNGNIKLVVGRDSTWGRTMIAESVNPDSARSSLARDKFSQVREELQLILYREPSLSLRRVVPPMKVTVTGVAFFGKLYGSFGSAPNGVEIAPVLRIENDKIKKWLQYKAAK